MLETVPFTALIYRTVGNVKKNVTHIFGFNRHNLVIFIFRKYNKEYKPIRNG